MKRKISEISMQAMFEALTDEQKMKHDEIVIRKKIAELKNKLFHKWGDSDERDKILQELNDYHSLLIEMLENKA